MAQRFDPITQNFQLSGLDSLFQQSPANLASSLLNSGMSPQEVSLQTGLSPDELMLLQRDQMTNVPVQPPMATMPLSQTGGIISTLNRDIMGGDPTGELAMMSSQMVDQMDMLGLTKDEDTADELDTIVATQINSAAEKVQSAEASGDPTQLAQAQKEANDITQLNASIISYLGNTPEERKAKMQIYKDAAATMLGGEDLEKYIRKPDEALPYMVAGMALRQSGEQGDDWITALTNAFSKYAVTKKQEDRLFDDKYLQFKMQRQARIDDFATQLALKDLTAQYDTSIGSDRSPYVVNGKLMHINPREVAFYEKNGATAVPYNSDYHADLKEYTVTDLNTGFKGVEHLTDATVSSLSGFKGIQLEEGNLLKDKNQYTVVYPEGFTNEKLPSVLNNGAGGRRNYLQLADAEIEDLQKQLSGTGIELVKGNRNLKKVVRNVDGIDRLLYIPESQVLPTDSPYESGVYFESDGVIFATGNTGSRTNEKYNKDITEQWTKSLNDATKVFSITDRIQKEVAAGAILPTFTRGVTSGLKRFLDEGSAIFNLIAGETGNSIDLKGIQATSRNGGLSKTGEIEFSDGDTYEAMFNRFVNSSQIQDLTGVSTANREYNALTFNLALAVASAFGLGDGRALSDKDLVFALEMVGYGSSNVNQLKAAHDRLRSQTYEPIANNLARYDIDADLTDKTKQNLNQMYDLPISQFLGPMTHREYAKMLSSGNVSSANNQQSSSALKNNRYSSFFEGLSNLNDNQVIDAFRAKSKEMLAEKKSNQDEFNEIFNVYLDEIEKTNEPLFKAIMENLGIGTEE